MGARRKFGKMAQMKFDYDHIRNEIANSSHSSSVYVGADSQVTKGYKRGEWVAHYVTTIILHKDTKHGGVIFKQVETLPYYGSLRSRLMAEVGYAVSAALELVDVIDDRPFEVHLDINSNPNHKSNVVIKKLNLNLFFVEISI